MACGHSGRAEAVNVRTVFIFFVYILEYHRYLSDLSVASHHLSFSKAKQRQVTWTLDQGKNLIFSAGAIAQEEKVQGK